MKKLSFLLFFWSCLTLTFCQEVVFFETCGEADVSTPKKADVYSGWDNTLPVTFSRTTNLDGFADVRKTSSATNHIWFPADKSSDLIISHIPASHYHQLLLSFDIAAYKLSDANVDKLTVLCNDSALTLPSLAFPTSKFIMVQDILLGNSDALTLHFLYSAQNNTNGYRIDNIRITGIKTVSAVNNPMYTEFNPVISGSRLLFKNMMDGTHVVIYNSLGSSVQASVVKAGFITLNTGLTPGCYFVRAGGYCGKFMLLHH